MNNGLRSNSAWLVAAGLLILSLGLFTGCNEITDVPASSPIPTTPAEFLPTATVPVTDTPQPTPTAEILLTPTPEPLARPQYQLSANLDYSSHLLDVQQVILVPHPADGPLQGIDLIVPANSWWGVFSIQDINTREIPLESYQLEGVKLSLVLGDSGWQPGKVLTLDIHYTLDLPLQNDRPGYGPSPFGYTNWQTNLVDWYPMVPPYQKGVGWLIHDPWIFGEYLVYPAADFEVSLTLTRSDLIVAASAPSISTGDTLQYSLQSARNFVFSISPNYHFLETNLGDVTIYGYFFPVYQVPSQAAFDATIQALALYQELYGPYDQSSLTMVQADFNHGMEYEGLYFLSKAFFDLYNDNGTEKSYLISIAVHETAHQWWYGGVANDQALEPWLDEALCTFSELAFYESQYPESVDWWWNTRINYYQPSGRIDRSIYGFQEYVDQYLNYRNATYLQGAKFMAALKDEMGEEDFYLFLREYGVRYKDQIAGREDFFNLLSEYLNWNELPWLGEYFLFE